ncbi:MAG: helix-turn-helix domain-containing protein, partial [Myxococcota bacterium]
TLFVPFSQDDLPARSDNAYPAASEPSSSERLARSTDRLERPTMPPLHAPPTLDSSGGYALQKGPITLTLETLDIVLPDEGVDLRALVEAIENTLIDQALARVEGNRAGAARLLKMNRTTLVERLKKRDKLRERRAKKAQASKED